jgi:hypothetical protein
VFSSERVGERGERERKVDKEGVIRRKRKIEKINRLSTMGRGEKERTRRREGEGERGKERERGRERGRERKREKIKILMRG